MSEQFRAVVDRIVDDRHAVLLLEEDGETVDELAVDKSALPSDGRDERAILDVEVEDGELVDATYLPDETKDRLERAKEKFDRLSEPLGDRDSKD